MDFENQVASLIDQHRLTGNSVDIAVRGTDYGDIRPALETALDRIGVTVDEFTRSAGAAGLVEFMDELPTRYVTNVMRSAKHRQTQQRWEPNDFIDIVSLPVAAVYCDVVVTEKQWVHHMRQREVDRRYGTELLHDTAVLVDVLVAASAS